MSCLSGSSDEQLEWLEQLRKESGVPETVNTEDAAMIHNNIADEDISPTTYRRWPVPYILLGRERRYLVTDVVAHAKLRVEQAPRRVPPQRLRKSRVRPPQVSALSGSSAAG
jgi:hypothetical protein